MKNQYAKLAVKAIEAATKLDDQQAALDVMSIVERSEQHQLDTMMRKVRKQLETAL